MSPKNILKQLKLWIPEPSAEKRNICGQEWNTVTIGSAILVLNTLSCWAACKAMCLIEHSSCDVIDLHHSSVQKVCCFLRSRVCQDNTTLQSIQSMRATTFNHAWEIKSGCKPLCVKRTWPTLIVSDLIWIFSDQWVRLLLSAYEVTAGTTIPTEHKCDNSKLPNQQQSVTQIAKRGVPQIDKHDVFDGLLHDTSAEADVWISSQDQSPAAARQLCHIRDVVAAKVQNSQCLAQGPLVHGNGKRPCEAKEETVWGLKLNKDLRPKRPCEAAPCSLERGQLSATCQGPQKILRLAELWSPGHIKKAQFLPFALPLPLFPVPRFELKVGLEKLHLCGWQVHVFDLWPFGHHCSVATHFQVGQIQLLQVLQLLQGFQLTGHGRVWQAQLLQPRQLLQGFQLTRHGRVWQIQPPQLRQLCQGFQLTGHGRVWEMEVY